jgi:hypothetical protein
MRTMGLIVPLLKVRLQKYWPCLLAFVPNDNFLLLYLAARRDCSVTQMIQQYNSFTHTAQSVQQRDIHNGGL